MNTKGQKTILNNQKSLLYSLIIGLGVVFLAALVVLLFQANNGQTQLKTVSQKPNSTIAIISPKTTVSPTVYIPPVVVPKDLSPWKEIEDASIVFEGKGGVTYMKNLHSTPVVIGEGEKPVLSPDQKKIAYLPPSRNADNPGNIVVVYDLETRKENKYETDSRQVPPTITRILWSPDSKYHLLNFSGMPDNSHTAVHSYPEGKELITFYSSPTSYKGWINSNQIVFQQGQPVSESRPWGAGLGQSIVSLNVLSGEKQILAKTDDLVDYHLFEVKQNQIYFAQSMVKAIADWETNEMIQVTYWKMNLDGSNKSQLQTKFERTYEKLNSIVEKQKILPIEGKLYSYEFNKSNPNWVVFALQVADRNLLSVMNIDKPNETFRIIAEGVWGNW